MNRMLVFVLAVAGFSSAVGINPAWAQGQQSVRIVGVIERVDGEVLVVKTSMAAAEVKVMPNTRLFGVGPAALSDIRPGVFVGVGGAPLPDGSQKAILVTIFPESMRGVGEGHYPWNRPNTTMTNATVESTVSNVEGQVMSVKYKGGEKNIVIDSGSVIRSFIVGDRNDLRPGANVAINGAAKSESLIEANSITVGRGGVVPN